MSFDAWLDDLTDRVREKQSPPPATACYTCLDTGVCMTMVCYGGPPIERLVYCIDCDRGNGPAGCAVDDADREAYLQQLVSDAGK